MCLTGCWGLESLYIWIATSNFRSFELFFTSCLIGNSHKSSWFSRTAAEISVIFTCWHVSAYWLPGWTHGQGCWDSAWQTPVAETVAQVKPLQITGKWEYWELDFFPGLNIQQNFQAWTGKVQVWSWASRILYRLMALGQLLVRLVGGTQFFTCPSFQTTHQTRE